jgi:hypothetical protein
LHARADNEKRLRQVPCVEDLFDERAMNGERRRCLSTAKKWVRRKRRRKTRGGFPRGLFFT